MFNHCGKEADVQLSTERDLDYMSQHEHSLVVLGSVCQLDNDVLGHNA